MNSVPEWLRHGAVVRLVSIEGEPDNAVVTFYRDALGRVGRVDGEPFGIGERLGVAVAGLLAPHHRQVAGGDGLTPWVTNLAPADEADLIYQRAIDELEA